MHTKGTDGRPSGGVTECASGKPRCYGGTSTDIYPFLSPCLNSILQVLQTIPPSWPVRTLSTFLSRSFRRTLHSHHEALLVKAVVSSENLEVSERTWEVLREQGAIIEEAAETEDGESVAEGIHEKVGGLGLELDEKAGLRGHEDVVDIPPPDSEP